MTAVNCGSTRPFASNLIVHNVQCSAQKVTLNKTFIIILFVISEFLFFKTSFHLVAVFSMIYSFYVYF